MNSVALTGTVVDDPQLSSGERGGDVCVMRIAVPRRSRGGRREPGVVYVDVAAFGAGAHESAARLREGDRIGLAGRLSREEYRAQGGGRRVDHAVLIEQLNLPVKRPY